MATRTTLLTALAVAGVIVAGTAAVAANIGILDAADSTAIGDLAATDQLVATPASPVATIPTSSSSVVTTVPSNDDGTTEYAVDDAGTVKLLADPAGLTLVNVTQNAGWTATATRTAPTSLTVGFTDGTRTVIFTATSSADGSIAADVTEPVVVNGAPASPTAQASATAAAGGDDDDREEHGDNGEHEYEGADDDD